MEPWLLSEPAPPDFGLLDAKGKLALCLRCSSPVCGYLPHAGSKVAGVVVAHVLAFGDGPLTEDEKSAVFPTS